MRAPGWEIALATEIDASKNLPFQWGSNDCVSFALRVLSAMGAAPKMRKIRAYKTEKGAMGALRRHGFEDLEKAGRSLLGEPLADVRLAQRGDVVLGPAFGIVIGRVAVSPGPQGLVALPVASMRLAWRS